MQDNTPQPPLCWVITEGMIGTQNQCVGVAEALGLTPKIIKLELRQPWKFLTPWLKFEGRYSFKTPLTPPWPDIVLASGRKAIGAARYIKKASKGKTFTVFIQDPKANPQDFDLVAVPHHDSLRGQNVVVTHGAPNRITPDTLAQAKTQFAPAFEHLPSPRIAVLIGGNSRTHTLTPDIMRGLVAQLKSLKGGLMITASRRTGDENLALLKQELAGADTYIWEGVGENPYFGMLAWADHIIVTSDSVSMLCDAGTTGKPVHMVELAGQSKRFDRLYAHFQEIGVMRPLTNSNLHSWSYEPLTDAQLIAKAIEKAR